MVSSGGACRPRNAGAGLALTPEKLVETQIKDFIIRSGGWVSKIHAGLEQGKNTLDLVGGVFGKPFFIEVKQVGGTPSKAQKILVKRAKRQGYVSDIVESLDEFKQLFEVMDESSDSL